MAKMEMHIVFALMLAKASFESHEMARVLFTFSGAIGPQELWRMT